MNDETKFQLIDQLRFCQTTIEDTLFNTRVAAKAKIEDETREAFMESITTQEETLIKLEDIIKGLQENQTPDLELLSINISKMVNTVLLQQTEMRGFVKLIFNQE